MYPNDTMVRDGDGVVVIPAEIAVEVAEEAQSMDVFEGWVSEQVAQGRSIVGLYPPNESTLAEFEQWNKSRHKRC